MSSKRKGISQASKARDNLQERENLKFNRKKKDDPTNSPIAGEKNIDSNNERKYPAKDSRRNSGIPKSVLSNSAVPYCLDHIIRGNLFLQNATKLKKAIIINHIGKFKVKETLCPFERRVTSMAWHPKYSQFFVAGSKGGELIMHRMDHYGDYFSHGVGAGGSIVGLKFSEDDPCTVYTASITGNIRHEDLKGKNSKNLMSTENCNNWFSCLDICYKRNILLSGDCAGYGYLCSTSGKQVWKQRLHGKKIAHCEFNQHNTNIFVTASIDHTVKLWDLRSVSDNSQKNKPLREFYHEKGVNSAYFSSSNGLNLLTTDQHSQLRVYSSPFWDETLVIKHPHRQFQHITPIEATWHPMEDIIIVGRFPDANIEDPDRRTIDFYDGTNGELLHKINSPSGNIASLNVMNITGDSFASTAGRNVVLMRDESILKGVSCNHGSVPESDDAPLMLLKRNRNSRSAPKFDKNITKKRQKTY